MENRQTIDCRKLPNQQSCTLTISGRAEELLKAALAHGIAVHGYVDSPEVRHELKGAMEDELSLRPVPGRKISDCRTVPSAIGCSLTYSGREDEVVKAAAEHAVSLHGHRYSPELEQKIRQALRDETSLEEEPAPAY